MEKKMSIAEAKDHLNHHIKNALFSVSFMLEDLKRGKASKITRDEYGNPTGTEEVNFTGEDAYEPMREGITRILTALKEVNENL